MSLRDDDDVPSLTSGDLLARPQLAERPRRASLQRSLYDACISAGGRDAVTLDEIAAWLPFTDDATLWTNDTNRSGLGPGKSPTTVVLTKRRRRYVRRQLDNAIHSGLIERTVDDRGERMYRIASIETRSERAAETARKKQQRSRSSRVTTVTLQPGEKSAAEMIAAAETLAELDEIEIKLRAPAEKARVTDAGDVVQAGRTAEPKPPHPARDAFVYVGLGALLGAAITASVLLL